MWNSIWCMVSWIFFAVGLALMVHTAIIAVRAGVTGLGIALVLLVSPPGIVGIIFIGVGLGGIKSYCKSVPTPINNDSEEHMPSVSISGVKPLVLFVESEIFTSPLLILEGIGSPAGGSYEWKIMHGVNKIKIEDGLVSNSTLMLKALQPSDSSGDIIVELKYTTIHGAATAQISLTVHTPSSTIQVSTQLAPFSGPVKYGYDHTVRYRILDQFGERFPEGSLFLTEDLSVILNPYNTHFEEREYVSDANTEYDDHYTLIFNNQPVPSDYIAKVRQVVRAQGVKILDHILVWKSTQVDFE